MLHNYIKMQGDQTPCSSNWWFCKVCTLACKISKIRSRLCSNLFYGGAKMPPSGARSKSWPYRFKTSLLLHKCNSIQGCRKVWKSVWVISIVRGIICPPLVETELSDLPKSGGIRAPCPPVPERLLYIWLPHKLTDWDKHTDRSTLTTKGSFILFLLT